MSVATDERTETAAQSSGEPENFGVYSYREVDGQIVQAIHVGVGNVSEADANAAAAALVTSEGVNVWIAPVRELVVPNVPVSTQDTAGDE